jgi:hypothetical protein
MVKIMIQLRTNKRLAKRNHHHVLVQGLVRLGRKIAAIDNNEVRAKPSDDRDSEVHKSKVKGDDP